MDNISILLLPSGDRKRKQTTREDEGHSVAFLLRLSQPNDKKIVVLYGLENGHYMHALLRYYS